MRFTLKRFQETAALELLRRLLLARSELAGGGGPQSIVFSSPTGSGKTVMLAAVLEAATTGGELAKAAGFTASSEATILWLSDRPDLNEQSRRRLLEASDGLLSERLVVIENDFDQPTFDEGKVYFLNFGKLTSTALLVRPGNDRHWTLWETLHQTARARRGNFIVVVDEAHYGLQRTQAERHLAATIPQRFMLGAENLVRAPGAAVPTLPMDPMPLVVGVSATPERLAHFLQEAGAVRTARRYDVPASEVRGSGLIKDRIVLYPSEGGETEWTLLREACVKLASMTQAWARQPAREGEATVVPALLIQVENAVQQNVLSQIISRIREPDALPELQEDQIVHCFGDGGDIYAGSWRVRRADPNEISGDSNIRVVLFKTALTTGWDCPRAEVLMSFRSAQEHTNIAQLVGRMVRTPRAEQIVGDETLNEVYLYLPKYDRTTVQHVIQRLTVDGDGGGSDVVTSGQTQRVVPRAESAALLTRLTTLPNEAVPSNRPMPAVRRILKLARALDRDNIGEGNEEAAVGDLLGIVRTWFAEQRQNLPDIEERIGRVGRVGYGEVIFDGGATADRGVVTVSASDGDIQRRYRAATLKLAPELGEVWLSSHTGEARRAMMEFIWAAESEALRGRVDARAVHLFDALFDGKRAWIRQLDVDQQAVYQALQLSGRHIQSGILLPVPHVAEYPRPAGSVQVDGHLFVKEGTGEEFTVKLGGWERRVIAAERSRAGFLAWLRNPDRKPWALSYAYEYGGTARPGYPDFLIFRRGEAGGIAVDIMEPHRSFPDSVAKLKGLARFADQNQASFGRICMSRERQGSDTIVYLPLHKTAVRARVRALLTPDDLDALFADDSVTERAAAPTL